MKFLKSLAQKPGDTHIVYRKTLFDDVVQLYRNNTALLYENPFKVAFGGEQALDCGGVCREMYSGFWEDACKNLFDGSAQLIPITHNKSAMSVFPTLGYVLSHGYLTCGYIPCRIAFPTLAQIVLGSQIEIPDALLVSTFADSISPVEASFIKGCFTITASVFSSSCQDRIISILSRFGTREISTPGKLRDQIVEAAYHEFMMRPMAAISSINSGIPPIHREFWGKLKVYEICTVFIAH